MLRIWQGLLLIFIPWLGWAHGTGGRGAVMTLPLIYYYIGGALVVLVSPIIKDFMPNLRPPIFIKKCQQYLAQIQPHPWALILFILAIMAGFMGRPDPFNNILPHVIWYYFWLVFILWQFIFGNGWHIINPFGWLVATIRQKMGITQQRPGDIILGLLGFIGFFYWENISITPMDPPQMAQILTIYWLFYTIGGVLWGNQWLENSEFAHILCRIIGASSLLPQQNPAQNSIKGEFFFIAFLLANVSFCGLKGTFFWFDLWGLNPLDFQGKSTMAGINLFGLLTHFLIFAGVLWLLTHILLTNKTQKNQFLLSLVPIAMAFHFAHYGTILLSDYAYIWAGLNDPFALGWNLTNFTADQIPRGFWRDYYHLIWLWNAQVVLIVLCHIISCWRGHGFVKTGWRFQAGLMGVLCLYTIYGLWLLSTPTAL